MAKGNFFGGGYNGANSSIAAQNRNIAEQQRRFQLLQNNAPELDPTTTWKLASSSGSDAQIVNDSIKAISVGTLKQSVQQLQDEPFEKQQSLWNSMSDARKTMFLDAGYKPKSKKDEGSWWKSILSPVGWAWDHGPGWLLRKTVGPAIGGALHTMYNIADDFASRPYRAIVDQTGKNQDARVDLMLNQARQELEKDGLSLTEDEWNYLKWSHEETHPRVRAYVGTDSGLGTGMAYKMGINAMPGGASLMPLLDSPIGKAASNIPFFGQFIANARTDVRTENQYDKLANSFAGRKMVSDDVRTLFLDKVEQVAARPDYDLSAVASWNRVDNGQSYVSAHSLQKAQEKLGGRDNEAFDIASYLAQNHDISDYLQNIEHLTPQSEAWNVRADDISNKYMNDEKFKTVIADMTKDQSKVSIGRDFAKALHIGEDTKVFTAVSGLLDAAHIILMDPFLIAGKAAKIARVARLGVPVSQISTMQKLYNVSRGVTESSAIIEGAENINKVTEAFQLLEKNNWLSQITTKLGIDNIKPLIDDLGNATEFAKTNSRVLLNGLTKAKDEIETIISYTRKYGTMTMDDIAAMTEKEAKFLDSLGDLRPLADAIDIAHGVVARTASIYPEFSLQEFGNFGTKLRNQALENHFKFVDRAVEAFKTLDSDPYALTKFSQDVPRGLEWVSALYDYHVDLLTKGKNGITSANNIYDFLKGKGLLGLQSGELNGLAVRGWGNGMQIPTKWMLFGEAGAGITGLTERTSLTQLPTLSEGQRLLRFGINKTNDIVTQLAEMENKNFISKVFNKTIGNPIGKSIFDITHHAPKGSLLSLHGKDAVLQFRKLTDMGIFGHMSRDVRDLHFENFLRGAPDYLDFNVRFKGIASELESNLNALSHSDISIEALKDFETKLGTKLNNLVDETGNGTNVFRDKFLDIDNWINESLESGLVNTESKTIQSLLQFEQTVNEFPTIATRRAAERGFLLDLFDRIGLNASEEGQKVAKQFVDGLDNYRYSPNDEDLINQLSSQARRVAVFPVSQFSSQVKIPSLAEIELAAGKLAELHGLRRVMNGLNRPFIDKIMQTYWKPSVLMRGGFVLSVGGDELLSFISRRGLSAPLAQLAGMSTADSRGIVLGPLSGLGRLPARWWGEVYKKGAADEIWKVSKILEYSSMRNYMENVVAQTFKDPKRTLETLSKIDHFTMMSDYTTAIAVKALRNVQFAFVPNYLKEALVSSAHATGRAAFMENAGLVQRADLAGVLASDTRGLLRTPFGSKSISEGLGEISHSNMMEEPAGLINKTAEIAQRDWAYGPEVGQPIIALDSAHWVQVDTNQVIARGEAPRIKRAYNHINDDPIAVYGIQTAIQGKVSETDLYQNLIPAFKKHVSWVERIDDAAVSLDDLSKLEADAKHAFTFANNLNARVRSWPKRNQELLEAVLESPRALLPEIGEMSDDALAKLEQKFLTRSFDWDAMPESFRAMMFVDEPNEAFWQLFNNLDDSAKEVNRIFGGDPEFLGQLNKSAVTQSDLQALLEMDRRTAYAIISDQPLRIANYADDFAELQKAVFKELQNPNYAGYVQSAELANIAPANGGFIANPPIPNTRTFYNVMADKDTIDQINLLMREKNGGNRLISELRAAGLSEDQLEIVRKIAGNWDETFISDIAHIKEATYNGILLPISPVTMTNYDDALALSQVFDEWTKTASRFAQDPLAVKSSAANVVSVGSVNRPYSTLERFTPNARRDITFNKSFVDDSIEMDMMLKDMQVLNPEQVYRFNDNGILDPTGSHAVEGTLRQDSLYEFSNRTARTIMGMVTGADGEYLHEIIVPMQRGTFSVESIANVAPNRLPRKFWAPEPFVPTGNAFEKLVKWGWDKVINPAIYSMVRHPMFLLSYSDGLAAARAATANLRNAELDKRAVQIMASIRGNQNSYRDMWAALAPSTRDKINDVDHLTNLFIRMSNPETGEFASHLGEKFKTLSNIDKTDMLQWLRHDAHVENLTIKTAVNRAMNDVIPYIHDHRTRSFFQNYARNLMPFEFAQEQFLKRWVNTFKYSPEAFRRMQLIEHGLSSSVFSEVDEHGEAVVVIPGSGALMGLLTKTPVGKFVWGDAAKVPVSVPLSMQVKSILPDIQHEFSNLPTLSPLAMVGANTIVNHFPALLGGQATGRRLLNPLMQGNVIDTQKNVFEQFVPSNYQRLFSAVFGDVGRSVTETNATSVAAVQQMEAEAIRLRSELDDYVKSGKKDSNIIDGLTKKINQLSLPDNASARDKEKYLDNVKNWAHANMFTRAITGFFMPAPVHNEFKNAKLAPEFAKLLQTMDFETAFGFFMAEHPNAQPYTIFTTNKNTRAPLAPTEKALAWMQDNPSIMKSFPLAGPWLMPVSNTESPYSAQAYNDQIGLGLRDHVELEEWYDSFKFNASANIYFPMKNDFELQMSETDDAAIRKQLQAEWDSWSFAFKNQHPIFAEKLASSYSNVPENTLKELSLALANEDLQNISHIEKLREAVTNWERYSSAHELLKVDNTKWGKQQRERLNTEFLDWGNRWVIDNPDMRSMWFSILLPATNLRTSNIVRKLKESL